MVVLLKEAEIYKKGYCRNHKEIKRMALFIYHDSWNRVNFSLQKVWELEYYVSGSAPLQHGWKLKIFIACRHGKYWKLYCDKVAYRIIPGIY